MKHVVLKFKDQGFEWTEDYNISENVDAEQYGKHLAEEYNKALRPGEKPREFVEAVGTKDNVAVVLEHNWSKTNLVSISSSSGMYDTLRCRNCGITAKRYGFENVIIDRKYKAKKYDNCMWKETKNAKR
jgi:uncharacterized protein YifE (UPF0438 family)